MRDALAKCARETVAKSFAYIDSRGIVPGLKRPRRAREPRRVGFRRAHDFRVSGAHIAPKRLVKSA